MIFNVRPVPVASKESVPFIVRVAMVAVFVLMVTVVAGAIVTLSPVAGIVPPQTVASFQLPVFTLVLFAAFAVSASKNRIGSINIFLYMIELNEGENK